MVIMTEKASIFEIGTTIPTNTSTKVTMETEMVGVAPMFHLKIVKFLLGMVEVVWFELRIYCRRL